VYSNKAGDELRGGARLWACSAQDLPLDGLAGARPARLRNSTRLRIDASGDRIGRTVARKSFGSEALPLSQGFDARTEPWADAALSLSVAVVTVRVIAVPVKARIEPAIPTVKTVAWIKPTAEPAAKTATESKTVTEAVKTVTSKPATVESPAKAASFCNLDTDARGQRYSDDGQSQQ
jgi:hypothetical protein